MTCAVSQIRPCSWSAKLLASMCLIVGAPIAQALPCDQFHVDERYSIAPSDTAANLPVGLAKIIEELESESKEPRFAGLAVVYVKAADILVCSFGKADLSKGTPIDSSETQFYVGSITKTFTGLAISQLLSTGAIHSIDDPVNQYLKRTKLEGLHGKPILIRHLLTHKAGLEDRNADVATIRSVAVPVPSEEIARLQPKALFEPGEFTSYSNFGVAVLGMLIEDVTGKSIQQYFRENIWNPLGMRHTDFATGLVASPTAVKAQNGPMGQTVAVPYLAFHPTYWPVGAIIASPLDMGLYARAHLLAQGPATFPGLDHAVYARAQSRLFGNRADVNGFAMLIMAGEWNGQTMLTHGGSWPYYNSMMTLYPGRGDGYFASIVSLASASNPLGIVELNTRLSSSLLGPRAPVVHAVGTPQELDLGQFQGIYLTNKRNESGGEKIIRFLSPDAGITEVSLTADKHGLMIGGHGPYVSLGDDSFFDRQFELDPANPFLTAQIGFVRDKSGQIIALTDSFGLWASLKANSLADPRLLRDVFQWSLPFLLMACLLPFWIFVDKRYRIVRTVLALYPVLLAIIYASLLWGYDSGGLEYYLLSGRTARFLISNFMGTILVIFCFVNAWYVWNLLLAKSGPNKTVGRWMIAHALLVLVASLPSAIFLVVTNLALHVS